MGDSSSSSGGTPADDELDDFNVGYEENQMPDEAFGTTAPSDPTDADDVDSPNAGYSVSNNFGEMDANNPNSPSYTGKENDPSKGLGLGLFGTIGSIATMATGVGALGKFGTSLLGYAADKAAGTENLVSDIAKGAYSNVTSGQSKSARSGAGGAGGGGTGGRSTTETDQEQQGYGVGGSDSYMTDYEAPQAMTTVAATEVNPTLLATDEDSDSDQPFNRFRGRRSLMSARNVGSGYG